MPAPSMRRSIEEIAEHDRRYHQEDRPTISDADYDELRRRNEEIEARFPALADEESRSRRVGAPPAEKFAKVRHRVPMLSLGQRFRGRRGARIRGARAPLPRSRCRRARSAFTAEPKIDGLSCASATKAGGSCGQRRAATARRARTLPRMSAPSATFPNSSTGMMCPRCSRCAARSIMTPCRFRRDQRAAGGARASRSSPIRAMPRRARCASSTRRSPRAGRCNSSPMPGAK